MRSPTASYRTRPAGGFYRSFYARGRLSGSSGTFPRPKDSAFTNFCDITVRVVRGRILVLACLDNLVKGAAGVAVQNLNLMIPSSRRHILRPRLVAICIVSVASKTWPVID